MKKPNETKEVSMKKHICIILFAVLTLVALTGCKKAAFVAEEYVIGDPIQTCDPAKAGERDVVIGEKTYTCTYDMSSGTENDGITTDFYNESSGGRVEVYSASGELCGFADIMPFERIDNVAGLSDDELAAAVKERVSAIADLDRFNEIRVVRDAGVGNYGQDMTVDFWQTIDGIEVMGRVVVRIDGNGDVCRYSGLNKDSEGETPRISDDERDRLVAEVVKNKFEENEIGDIKIYSEAFTTYKGRSALFCHAAVYDVGGVLLDIISVMIYKK